MKQVAFGKIGTALLALVIAFSVVAPALTPVSAAPTVPSTNNYIFVYDPQITTRNDNYWQVGYIGSKPRPNQNLPDGYWYPNTAFDSAWFDNTYAYVGAPQGYSATATLRAKSTYDLLWGGRGWSNAFIHQGRPPYAGGVYEGHFKAGSTSGSAIPVDGIRYAMNTTEPTGKYFVKIKLFMTKNDLNCWQSNNGILLAFLFQYEWQNGSLSLYDAPAFTNGLQSLHFDMFFHRDFKTANIPMSFPVGWSYTIGDCYNGDIHLQYVYNSHMNLNTWYEFTVDLGSVINQVKQTTNGLTTYYYGIQPSALILRYVQVSAETCGGEIGVIVDDVQFYTT